MAEFRMATNASQTHWEVTPSTLPMAEEKRKNLDVNPARGGIPASENRNSIIANARKGAFLASPL